MEKKHCYRCGVEIEESEAVYLPVSEDGHYEETLPKAPFCETCAKSIEES